MQHAAPTLKKIFRNAVRRAGSNGALLAWPLACGSKIAARTQAVRFADGVLTVAVPDATWRLQLQDLRSQYLAALNQVTPEPVKQIEFVLARD